MLARNRRSPRSITNSPKWPGSGVPPLAEPLPLAHEMLERRSIRGSKTHLWVDRFALARERRSAKAVLTRAIADDEWGLAWALRVLRRTPVCLVVARPRVRRF